MRVLRGMVSLLMLEAYYVNFLIYLWAFLYSCTPVWFSAPAASILAFRGISVQIVAKFFYINQYINTRPLCPPYYNRNQENFVQL